MTYRRVESYAERCESWEGRGLPSPLAQAMAEAPPIWMKAPAVAFELRREQRRVRRFLRQTESQP